MKKTICLFILIILFYMVIGNVVANNNLIPEDAIRIRIIANSNSNYDQEIKNKVKQFKRKYAFYDCKILIQSFYIAGRKTRGKDVATVFKGLYKVGTGRGQHFCDF